MKKKQTKLKSSSTEIRNPELLLQDLKEKTKINEQLKQEILDKTDKLREFQAIKSELEDVKEENESLKKSSEAFNHEAGKIIADNRRLVRENMECKDILHQQEQYIMHLNTQVKKLSVQLQTTNDTNESLNTKVNDSDEILKQQASDLAKTRQDLQSLESSMKQNEITIEQLKKESSNYQEKLKKTVRENQDLNNQITILKSNVEEQQNTIQELDEERYALLRSVEMRKTTDSKLSKTPSHSTLSLSQLETPRKSDSSLDLIRSSLSHELELSKYEASQMQSQCYMYKNQIDELNVQKKRLASSRARFKNSMEELNQKLEKQMNINDELSRDNEKLKKEISNYIEDNTYSSTALRRLFEQKTQLEDNFKNRIDRLEDERNDLEAQITQLQLDISERDKTIKALKKDNKLKTKEVDKMQEKVKSVQLSNMCLENSRSSNKRQASINSELVNEEFNDLKRENDDLKNQIYLLKQEKAKSKTFIHDTMSQYEAEIKKLTNKLNEQQALQSSTISHLESDNTKLKREVNKYENQIDSVNHTCNQKLISIEYEMKKLQTQLDSANIKIEKMNELIEELKNENAELTDFVSTSMTLFGDSSSLRTPSAAIQVLKRAKETLDENVRSRMVSLNQLKALEEKMKLERQNFINQLSKKNSI